MDRDDEFTAFAQSATTSLLRLGWLLTADGHQAQDLVQSASVRTYVAWDRRPASRTPSSCEAGRTDGVPHEIRQLIPGTHR